MAASLEASKEAHRLSCKRSNTADQKLTNMDKYCKSTGYMGLLCLKPTWTRGVARAYKSDNWAGPVLVPKVGWEGKGDKELIAIDDYYLDIDKENVPPGANGNRNNAPGSPRGSRTVGMPASKKVKGSKSKKSKSKKKVVPVRCYCCGEVKEDDDQSMWIFCGGKGKKGKGCQSFNAHCKCWHVKVSTAELKAFCRKFIRCHDCMDLEAEAELELAPSESDSSDDSESDDGTSPSGRHIPYDSSVEFED